MHFRIRDMYSEYSRELNVINNNKLVIDTADVEDSGRSSFISVISTDYRGFLLSRLVSRFKSAYRFEEIQSRHSSAF